jgi:hypothetical protein
MENKCLCEEIIMETCARFATLAINYKILAVLNTASTKKESQWHKKNWLLLRIGLKKLFMS